MKSILLNGKFEYVLTRREIIQLWEKQSERQLNSYCCPACRDILYEYDGKYMCGNSMCKMSAKNDNIQ